MGQAHIISGVVMDVAAFKVCHSLDTDTTALRAAGVRSKSIGAMDEMSHKVQNASTHPLRRQSHEHTHNSRSVQVPVHGGDIGNVTERRFKMQTLTGCDAKVVSTRTAVGQFKGQFKGASSRASSRWMKVQGKFKMQAHPISVVVMDIAAFKVSHSAGITDIDATALRAARASSSSIHRGDGGNLWARAEDEHTSVASLEYTLVLVSVAVP